MSTIDLSQLTPPNVIEPLDFETLLAARKARFISLYPVDQQADIAALLTLESEPIVKLLQENTYRELILRARYNDEARAVMVAYAKGADLDHIGITYYQEPRLLITPSNNAVFPPAPAVYESDDEYRARLVLKPESYSVAGPTGAYIYHAKSASGQVLDASCTSPNPGTSVITVLSRAPDGIADAALLSVVNARLSSSTVRPLCEEVIVQSATILTYKIEFLLYVQQGPDATLIRAEAIAALQAYAAERYRLGYEITASGLYAAAHRSGVDRAVKVLPSEDIIFCDQHQAARCTGIHVVVIGWGDV